MIKLKSHGSGGASTTLLNNPQRDFKRANRKLITVGPTGLARVGKRADAEPTTKLTEKTGIIKTATPPTMKPMGVGADSAPPLKAVKSRFADWIGGKG